jgi:predicted HicB family RNase H-like nuclease
VVVVRQMAIRVSEEELREWKIAAAIKGYSLAEWARRVLNVTAKGVKERYGELERGGP